jgi:hypothetical protein
MPKCSWAIRLLQKLMVTQIPQKFQSKNSHRTLLIAVTIHQARKRIFKPSKTSSLGKRARPILQFPKLWHLPKTFLLKTYQFTPSLNGSQTKMEYQISSTKLRLMRLNWKSQRKVISWLCSARIIRLPKTIPSCKPMLRLKKILLKFKLKWKLTIKPIRQLFRKFKITLKR